MIDQNENSMHIGNSSRMSYYIIFAAAEAAYSAKRSVIHHMDANNERLPAFDALNDEQMIKLTRDVYECIDGSWERMRRCGWDDPDRIFWLVARIVARTMGHEVLDHEDVV